VSIKIPRPRASDPFYAGVARVIRESPVNEPAANPPPGFSYARPRPAGHPGRLPDSRRDASSICLYIISSLLSHSLFFVLERSEERAHIRDARYGRKMPEGSDVISRCWGDRRSSPGFLIAPLLPAVPAGPARAPGATSNNSMESRIRGLGTLHNYVSNYDRFPPRAVHLMDD